LNDDYCLLEVSKQTLSSENEFEIKNAIYFDEAFQKMQNQEFDVAVSDYEMPQKKGLNLLKNLIELITFRTKN
jgi:DNA-binding NtrC family response regulator